MKCVIRLSCVVYGPIYRSFFNGLYCKRFSRISFSWAICGAAMNNIEANQSETTSREDKFRGYLRETAGSLYTRA